MRPEDSAAAFIARLEDEAQHHDVATPCGPVRWRRFGQGPHLALLHGGHGSWLHWARNIRPLASRYTVWVPDLPGYGDSMAPTEATLAAVVDVTWRSLDRLIGDKVALVLAGFSFGGLVAASLAARRGAVTHLALLGPAAHGGSRRPRGELRAWREASQCDGGAELALLMRHNLQAHMLHHADAVDDLALRIHTSACLRTRFRSKPISRAASLAGWLAGHRGQVLLAWGEHDVTAEPAQAAATLLKTCPHARAEVVPHAGHWVQYEAADLTNRLLLAWLDETSAVTAAKEPT